MRVGSESTLPYGVRVNGSRASFNLPFYVRRRALGGGIGNVLGVLRRFRGILKRLRRVAT